MAHEDETLPAADEGPVQRTVRPCAWIRETGGTPVIYLHAAENTAPLFDSAALDAAVAAERERCAADRDMLRDTLAALAGAVGMSVIDLGTPIWHALEDAQQALAQCGGPNVGGKRQ